MGQDNVCRFMEDNIECSSEEEKEKERDQEGKKIRKGYLVAFNP